MVTVVLLYMVQVVVVVDIMEVVLVCLEVEAAMVVVVVVHLSLTNKLQLTFLILLGTMLRTDIVQSHGQVQDVFQQWFRLPSQ